MPPNDEYEGRQAFFGDALLQNLAHDEPEDSIIRQVAERRGLVRPISSPLPDWCVVNAWVRRREPLGQVFQIIAVSRDLICLRGESEDIAYRQEPATLFDARFEPAPPPLRGRRFDNFLIDDNAYFRRDWPGATITFYDENMNPVMTSEEVPVRFDTLRTSGLLANAEAIEIEDGSGYQRVEADATPAPTRFDREDPV